MSSSIVNIFAHLCHTYLEKAMAPHSSTLAWKIPWTEEHGRLRSMGSKRFGHDWATSLSLFTFMHWRRKWQPTPGFLPGESQGRRNLLGSSTRGRYKSDRTEWLHFHFSLRALEKEMATYSSVLAGESSWRIPGMGEPGGLLSMGSQSQTRLKRLSSSSSHPYCAYMPCLGYAFQIACLVLLSKV